VFPSRGNLTGAREGQAVPFTSGRKGTVNKIAIFSKALDKKFEAANLVSFSKTSFPERCVAKKD